MQKHTSLIRELLPHLKGCRGALVYLFIVGFFLLLPGIALPAFFQFFFDAIFAKNLTSSGEILIAVMGASTLVAALLTALQGYFLARLNVKLSVRFSTQFLWHVLRLPLTFFDKKERGEIASRLSAGDTIVDILTNQGIKSVFALVLVVFYGIFLFYYDTTVAFIAIGLALFNLISMYWMQKNRLSARFELGSMIIEKENLGLGSLQNIESLKSTSSENLFFRKWQGLCAAIDTDAQKIAVKDFFLAIIPPFTQMIGAAAVLTIGGMRVIEGKLSIGMLFGLQTLMATFLAPVTRFVYLGQKIEELKTDLSRLDEVMSFEIDKQLQQFQVHGSKSKLLGDVKLENVSFGYSQDQIRLKNISLHIPQGSCIGITGQTGSGKSSLARLLVGLYTPLTGEVLFDDKPISAISRDSFTSSVSLATQEIFLFHGTVRDNLTLWDAGITDDSLFESTLDAGIHSNILQRPEGYDSIVYPGGTNFSGGERYRLTIARALTTNPSFIVLDEVTDPLDLDAEHEILKWIKRRSCSVALISHRIETLSTCDKIFVLHEGHLAQQGSHDELINQRGYYQDLSNRRDSTR